MPSVRPGGRGHPTPASPRRGRCSRLLALALVGVFALVATFGGDQPAARAVDGPSGALAVPRGHELWAVVAATGADRLLAARPTTAAVLDAAWANGRRLVFAQLDLPRGSDPGGSDLYLLDASGATSPLRLRDAPGVTLVSPAAQPDGSILYTYTPYLGTGADASPRVERLGPDGAVAVVLRGATFPAPTPDGRQLVYVKSTARGDALAIANGDGSGQRELVAADRFLGLAYPRVSPDGASVAFVATVDVPPPDPNGPLEVCAWAPPSWAAGASSRASRARPGRLVGVCAPEGAHRGSAHGLPWDVWLMRLDGGDLQRVSYLLEDEPSLAWSPDGRWLAVQGGSGLTLIEVASGRAERLAPYTAYGAIDWAAD